MVIACPRIVSPLRAPATTAGRRARPPGRRHRAAQAAARERAARRPPRGRLRRAARVGADGGHGGPGRAHARGARRAAPRSTPSPCSSWPSAASCPAGAWGRTGASRGRPCWPGLPRGTRAKPADPRGRAMASGAPRPIVLVPGACLGGWCWSEVAARLRAPVTTSIRSRSPDWASACTWRPGHRPRDAHRRRRQRARLRGRSPRRARRPQLRRRGGHRRRRSPAAAPACRRLPGHRPAARRQAIVDLQPPAARDRQRRRRRGARRGLALAGARPRHAPRGLYGSAGGPARGAPRAVRAARHAQPYATFTSPLRLAAPAPAGVRRWRLAGDGGSAWPPCARRSPRATRALRRCRPGLGAARAGHRPLGDAVRAGPLAELLHAGRRRPAGWARR